MNEDNLLSPKAGYGQYTNPILLYPTTKQPKILNILVEMEKNNRSQYTIKTTQKALTRLAQFANLDEPEAVKLAICKFKAKNGYKRALSIAYNKYVKYYGLQWKMPIYEPEAQNVALPTKEKLLMLIANARPTLSLKLQISMETGLRPVELCRLSTRDVDLDHKTINPQTAKRGNARTLPISEQLKSNIQNYIIKNKLLPQDKLFKISAENYAKAYRQMRNKLSKKINDLSIHQIRLYDFRHYFCTKKLYDLNNPFTVMILMGHKKLATTQRYMHMINLESDEYECSGVTTAKAAIKLIEAGFQYVTEIEGIKLFKKRK